MQDVLKSQGFILRGPESNAIKTAVKTIHECAERFASEKASVKLIEIFQLTTPQGAEVLEWLSSCKLSPFSHVFARNRIYSIRKVSRLTTEELKMINDEYYSTLVGKARESQVGSRIALGEPF